MISPWKISLKLFPSLPFNFILLTTPTMKKTMESLTIKSIITNKNLLLNCLIILSFSLWLYILLFNPLKPATTYNSRSTPPLDPCTGRYIYMQNLPSKFNLDLIHSCHNLSIWTDMCPFVDNHGFGPPLQNTDNIFSDNGWYATNQFTLEIIFHNKMKNYECITTNSSLASAVYVPYYAGLSILRYLWGFNASVRDAGPVELVDWIKTRPEWTRMGGRDHFLVVGRITWDFRRLPEYGDWGTRFLLMDEVRNMSALIIEASPWHGNDFGIPYPTYFHPSTIKELVSWQGRMRRLHRPWLFSFAGAPRPNMTESIRSHLIKQCRSSDRCNLIECDLGAIKCNSPPSVMKAFQGSVFCLQPPGDSYTRRSVFDAMLAGCIPVFFHPGTAYIQYLWHLPKNYTQYSVFISEDDVRDGKVRVEEVLMRFDEEEVKRMREEVVSLIPMLVYTDPSAKLEGVKDAFDVAVEGVLERVKRLREGNSLGFEDEQNTWKYALGAQKGEKHEWDRFFYRGKR